MVLIFIPLVILILYLSYKYYEHKNIYFPERDFIATPGDFGIKFKEVKFSSRDKVLLYGWFVGGEGDKMILFCHGNGGNISHRIETIEIINHLGYDLFIFDYRGYGKSNGVPTERGLYQDALGAYDFLIEKGYTGDDIILYGRSLGGAVAIYLATMVEVSGLIIESSFSSIYALSYDVFGFHIPRHLISNKYKSIERIKDIRVPKLIVHSKDDDLIPFHHGQRLYEAAPDPKEFLTIHGSHNSAFLDSEGIYVEKLSHFLNSL